MASVPSIDQVRTLPASFDEAVAEDHVDENGHMNISVYFRLGSWAPWRRLRDLGMGDDYIPTRGLSFFTVGHHIDYTAELRLGEPFTVRSGFIERTGKALRSIAYVVDESRDRIACTMELTYVHVSMETRRAAPIPDDLAAALDAEIAAYPWLADAGGGLSLRKR